MEQQYPFYSIVEETRILQGDILDDCPVLVPSTVLPKLGKIIELDGEIVGYDVIIMSQSCDLEQKKVNLVLVCPYWPFAEFAEKESYFGSRHGKENLKNGFVSGYHLLPRCDLEEFRKGPCVVDFRNVYGIPHNFLEQRIAKNTKRLRLMPPYREHLSQAFARFFMRVGLPIDIDLD